MLIEQLCPFLHMLAPEGYRHHSYSKCARYELEKVWEHRLMQ